MGANTEQVHQELVNARLGLTDTELAFDQNMIEAVAEVEARDLLALWRAGAVGHQGELQAAAGERVQCLVHAGMEPHRALAMGVERAGQLVGEFGVVDAERLERVADDGATRDGQVAAACSVARRFRPEPSGRRHDCITDLRDVATRKPVGEPGKYQSPSLLGQPVAEDQRIVEVEEDGLRRRHCSHPVTGERVGRLGRDFLRAGMRPGKR